MEHLGKYLFQLREAKGLSYQKIWNDIRIDAEKIKALEQNRLRDIGNYGLTKALVFNYARYLEADVEQVMAEFKIMMPEHTKKDFNTRKELKEKKIMLSTNFLWTVGIVIFVAILGSILLHAYYQGWLQTPDFFKAKPHTEENMAQKAAEPEKPDSLRLRMRVLSETIPNTNTATDLNTKSSVPADTTDYIGNILGKSPVNVQIN